MDPYRKIENYPNLSAEEIEKALYDFNQAFYATKVDELIENIQADAEQRLYAEASYKFKETRADRRKLKMAVNKNKYKKR